MNARKLSSRWRRTALLTGFVVVLGTPLAVLAASGATGVAERQASMKQMAAAVKTIAGMFGGQTDIEAPALHSAASVLRAHSGAALVAQFPDDGLDLPDSNAASAIAIEKMKFEALALRLHNVADAFDDKTRDAVAITEDMRMGKSMVMGGSLLGAKATRQEANLDTLPAEHLFHMMLETCTSCHSAFRVNRRM